MRNLEIKNNDSLASYEREPVRTLLPESGADAPAVLSAVYTDSTPARNRQSDAPQYGRSMIEMLGVLAIIGVLSVGGIAGYSKAMMKYRINKTIEQISLISSNVQSFFAPQKNYSGLNQTVIKKAKLVPDENIELKTDGTIKLKNEFDGEMGVYNYNNRAFVIALGNLPQEACIELATKDWSSANPYAISINTSVDDLINMNMGKKFTYNNCTSGAGLSTGTYQPKGYVTCDTMVSLETATTYCDSVDNNFVELAFH